MKQIYLIILLAPFLLQCQTKNSKSMPLKIIVFSKTDGYRHESIPTGIKTIQELALENGWEVFATEDSNHFDAEHLKQYDLIIFLSTIGNILNDEQQQAVEQFVESGKGLLTIHSGTITEPDWPWYQQAIGARFSGHPPTQKGTVLIENREHPSTRHFPSDTWETTDEWYSFTTNPREQVTVLISIDESSYNVDDNSWFEGVNQRMGDHPLVWYQRIGKGLVFQSAFGHPDALYSDPVYRAHLVGAIEATANLKK
jgi:uncharacterized protein